MAETPKTAPPAKPIEKAQGVSAEKVQAAEKVLATKPKFTARLKFARMSARKMRYVVDLVRGKDYNTALGILRSCSKRGAPYCKKLLESAYENAMDMARNRDLDIDGNNLHLVEARVDGGPIIKRWRPSSQRRPNMIKKRTCHVTFILEERELKEPKKERAKRQHRERQQAEQAKKGAAKPAEAKSPAQPAPAPSTPGAAEAGKPQGTAPAATPAPKPPTKPQAGKPAPKPEGKGPKTPPDKSQGEKS
jgi:large subunit ribosomal protein L22